MGTVTATLALNMADPFDWSGIYGAYAVGPTSSTSWWAESLDTKRWQFVGTGFGGYQQNIPNSGTITSVNIFNGADPWAQITGLSVTIPTFFTYLAGDATAFLNLAFAGNDTINGSAFNDFLTGYGGVDVMNGGDGDDTFLSAGTHDIMDGGAGADTLQLNRSVSSASFSFSTVAMATNTGVTFADGTVVRNFEHFQITAGAGNDAFIFTAGAMALGHSNTNSFHGGGGSDRIEADLSALTGAIVLTETQLSTALWSLSISSIEQYTLSTGSGDDLLNGGALADTFNGGGGDDRLIGRGGANTLIGGAGNDTIEASGVGELLDGGADFDTLVLDRGTATGAIVLLAHELAGAGATLSDGTVVRGFERFNITTGSGDDTLYLIAPTGANSFHAGGGVDSIALDLSTASDIIVMNSDGQQVNNFAFTITMSGVERFQITGGIGNDTLVGLDRDDWLHGGAGNDVINARAGNNTIYGAEGNDTITAGIGNDLIEGGDGDDRITGGGGLDVIDGGDGVDTVIIDRSASAATNYTTSTLTSSAGIDFGDGASIRNTEIFRITAGAGNDTLSVDSNLAGHYVYWDLYSTFDAGGGYDVFTANFSASSEQIRTALNTFSIWDAQVIQIYNFERMEVWGGSNNDLFYGGTAGDDYFNGGGGNDLIRESAGNNTLIGGGGDDELWTSTGIDTLDGGDGTDRVVIHHEWSTVDHIIRTSDLAAGMTLSNGATISNFERWDIYLGSGDDTLIIDSLFEGTLMNQARASFHGGAGFDRFYADFSSHTGSMHFSANSFSGGNYAQISLDGIEEFTFYGGSVFDNIFGGDGTDYLNGGGGGDRMGGGGGDDIIVGGIGDDDISGGSGYDIAIFSVASTAASWTNNVNLGYWHVTAGADGTDRLEGVEALQFTDRTIYLRPAENDLFGRLGSDIVLRRDDGVTAIWDMNGATVAESSLTYWQAGPEWDLQDIGDFTGDGRADMLWRHIESGVTAIWRAPTYFFINAAVTTWQAGIEWQIQGVGDFDRDGRDDFLWRRGDGVTTIWHMDGANVISSDVTLWQAGNEWTVRDIGDFDGDGHADILWQRDSDGVTSIWQMDGTNVVNADVTSQQAGVGWSFVGVGDFNGDARDDLLLRNADGVTAIWMMNGANVLGADVTSHQAGLDWSIAAVGDYNNDGRDDIVLRHESGALALWTMNGVNVINADLLSQQAGPEWDVI